MKKSTGTPSIRAVRLAAAAFSVLLGTCSALADEYDDIRLNYRSILTGGSSYNPLDTAIAAKLSAIDSAANGYWTTMDTSPTRTYLWSDLQSTTVSAEINQNYQRLYAMALAYCTHGSSLQNNATLLSDVIGGLDWMNTNRYNTTVTTYDNWFYWEIASPRTLNNIVVLLYANLTSTQRTNYMDAVERFSPDPTVVTTSTGGWQVATGANRVNKANVVAMRGVIVKNSTKIASGRDALTDAMAYVTTGDGFYSDGSFIFHGFIPYLSVYGNELLQYLVNMLAYLQGTTWAVTHSNLNNVYRWVYDSFDPGIYKGSMFDMLAGRGISSPVENHQFGHVGIDSILRLSVIAPAADAANYKRMVKAWVAQDTFLDYLNYIGYDQLTPIYSYLKAKAIMDDSGITAWPTPSGVFQFPSMDRTTNYGSNYAFGISMFSNRVRNYASINTQNLKGWYTSYGQTYLYNSELDQYCGGFWPTVNPHRLPGTTVDTKTKTNSENAHLVSTKNWVGGTEVGGFGATGQDLDDVSTNLLAKKSWFMFDDEIVALGAGITNTGQSGNGWDGTARRVETIVENRRLNASGNNAFSVNGTAKSTTLGWSETMSAVSYAHFTGSATGADIGYYFPTATTVKGLRESRTNSWNDISGLESTTSVTNRFLTLWLDHGTNPTNATYAYAILPGKSASQVSSYASAPNFTILSNTTGIQAVYEKTQEAVGANFWNDGTASAKIWGADYVTSDKKASVFTRLVNGVLEVGVSDPTQANTGSIIVEIHRPSWGTISYDPEVVVTSIYPTIKMTVNVNGTKGRTLTAKFSAITPNYHAAKDFSGTQGANQWSYQSWNGSTYTNMTWEAASNRWKGPSTYCLIYDYYMHPDAQDSVRKWVAPSAGSITIEGTVKKTDVGGGDGVNAKIFHNTTQIYNQDVAFNDAVGYTFSIKRTVAAGDAIYFRLNQKANRSNDSTYWDPKIYTPSPSKTYTASTDFSSQQGVMEWRYQTWNGTTYVNMTWDAANSRWNGAETYSLVMQSSQHPDSTLDAVRKWRAPAAGSVTITGNVAKGQSGGDGIVAKVLHNTTEIFNQFIAGTDMVGVSHNLTRTVAAGDEILFVVNRFVTRSTDTTNWDPVIVFTP